LVLFVAGMLTIRKPNSDIGNFNQHHSGDTSLQALSAMIYIIFSYQGMADVNCVRSYAPIVISTLLTRLDCRRDKGYQANT
jgi:hypothetical protein